MKITRIRCYRPKLERNEEFRNQSNIVAIETDQGITGIGEGGSRELLEQCAVMLIGENPFRTEYLWQLMFRSLFSPAGRDRLHAIGALDMALWDIKGKALGVPVYELLGGLTRNYVECYSTGFRFKGGVKETARACLEAGFRAFRTGIVGASRDGVFNSHAAVPRTFEHCQGVREAIGQEADWAIDLHTRLDLPDSVALCTLLEPLRPYYVEDPLRSENHAVYRTLRHQVKVPIAMGEQLGTRWDTNELIEQHLIDYTRLSLPQIGGITEYMKLAVLCETHCVGLIPHFTGPVAEAALVHCCSAFSGPVIMEMRGDHPPDVPHLPRHYDFRNGKMWPNTRPGLGVELDPKATQMVLDITERFVSLPVWRRPDGSMTNW